MTSPPNQGTRHRGRADLGWTLLTTLLFALVAASVACSSPSPTPLPPQASATSTAVIAATATAGAPAGATPTATATPTPTGVDPESPGAAAQVVRDYYIAINEGSYERAYEFWGDGGRNSRQTFDQFRLGYLQTRSVQAMVGAPGPIDPAAGSRYIQVPVTITAITTDGRVQNFNGTLTLRRSVVDGATAEQRTWHIYMAAINQIRTS